MCHNNFVTATIYTTCSRLYVTVLRADHVVNDTALGIKVRSDCVHGICGLTYMQIGTTYTEIGRNQVDLALFKDVAVLVDDALGRSDLEKLPSPAAHVNLSVAHSQWRKTVDGDHCQRCAKSGKTGTLHTHRGIELGHTFYLGRKYSEPFNVTVTDAAGQSRVVDMGCYGLGVTRILAAIIDVHHDECVVPLCQILITTHGMTGRG